MEIRVIGRDIQIDQTTAIAVENDNATETACFILDRYTESGIDLSQMSGFIVYSNELGTRFEALNTNLVGDKIRASWVVTRSLTTVNGRFLFGLTFLSSAKYDDLSSAEKVWSTNIAKSNITGSLVGDDYAVPEEPIIVQMLAIASTVTAAGAEVQSNAQKAQQAEKKATEEAAKTEGLINSLVDMIDTINGESVTYVDSIDAINGEVI